MDQTVIKMRLSAVRRKMRSKGLDCLIVTAVENVTFTTGFLGDDSWAVITPRSVILVTDSRYGEQAQSECVGCRIVERTGPIEKAAADIIARTRSVKTVAAEDSCSVAIFKRIKKSVSPRPKAVGGIVESVRQMKDPSEVRAIQKAGRIAWQALDHTLRRLKTGMTESQAAGLLDYQIRRSGSQNSFDTIVAFGGNGSRNHHQPGGKKLRKNDTILIDFGAKVDGYCSDTTRSFAFGKPTRFFENVYYAVLDAQQAAIKMVRPGIAISEIDAVAREVISSRGLPVYGHGTGHGLGLKVHEAPILAKKAKGKLTAGQVITIEPGIYIPGKLGVRIEDDILVTPTGHRNLTKDNRFNFSKQKMPVIKSR
ncbi:MAG: aminopeptidase P family protein [Planctomycetes bacterium]|nr:aminopeptidase P family protein [Planctomycetota bacterium]